jgi:hypothetical protein
MPRSIMFRFKSCRVLLGMSRSLQLAKRNEGGSCNPHAGQMISFSLAVLFEAPIHINRDALYASV